MTILTPTSKCAYLPCEEPTGTASGLCRDAVHRLPRCWNGVHTHGTPPGRAKFTCALDSVECKKNGPQMPLCVDTGWDSRHSSFLLSTNILGSFKLHHHPPELPPPERARRSYLEARRPYSRPKDRPAVDGRPCAIIRINEFLMTAMSSWSNFPSPFTSNGFIMSSSTCFQFTLM